MKKILLTLMVLALPVMGQVKVWEVALAITTTTKVNTATATVDSAGNAAVLHYEYDDPNSYQPSKTTLLMVSSRGSVVSHELAVGFMWYVVSYQRGSAVLRASRLVNGQINHYNAPLYTVKTSGKNLLGKWVELETADATQIVQREPINGLNLAQSTFNGWIEKIKLAGHSPTQQGSPNTGYNTLLFPIVDKIRLMKP